MKGEGATEARRRRRGPPCRPFNLGDAMILVAGVAVMIVTFLDRALVIGEFWPYLLHALAETVLMQSAFLVLILRLRRPRPPIRRIVNQPGAAACLAMVGVMFVVDARRLISCGLGGDCPNMESVVRSCWTWLTTFEGQSAAVVPIVWTLMALGRRWRPEPGWIDRSGRVVGWCWIVWMVSEPFASWLSDYLLGPRRFTSIM